MTANPFIRLWEAPIETLAVFAYSMVLLSALLITFYALGRNLMTLYLRYENETWPNVYPPMTWMGRLVAIPLVLALDALLLGTLLYFML